MIPECLKLRECSVTMSSPSSSPTMILSINSCISPLIKKNGRVESIDGMMVLSGGDDSGMNNVNVGAGEEATVVSANGIGGGGGQDGEDGFNPDRAASNPDHVRQLLSRFMGSNSRMRARKRPMYAIRPCEDPKNQDDAGGSSAGENSASPQSSPTSPRPPSKDVMIIVFSYLSRRDLVTCMQVCREWNKWTMDPRLWRHIDFWHTQRFTAHHLTGIVRRQTASLDLSWSSINEEQVRWLCERLPCLQSLSLAGLSWSVVSALRHYCCPPTLRSLDLSYVSGLTDSEVRFLMSAPLDGRPGQLNTTDTRLRNLTRLSLTGARIVDSTLSTLSARLPSLRYLDVSHCCLLSDHGIRLLLLHNTSDTLELVKLHHCPKVTLQGCSRISEGKRVRLDLGDRPQSGDHH